MDIHINVRDARAKDSVPGKIRILLYESETWNKFVGHMERAAARQLVEDLRRILSEEYVSGTGDTKVESGE